MSKAAEDAGNRDIQKARDKDPRFDEKCEYHQQTMDKLLNGKIPMVMDETKEGQAELTIINAKVSAAMVAKFGE